MKHRSPPPFPEGAPKEMQIEWAIKSKLVMHMLPRAPQGSVYLAKAVLLRQSLKDAGGASSLST